MDLTEKILFYMKRYHMIPENKNIVVGLSGGADSVCLLYVLVALRKKLGLQLCAVHVHHGLRGVEADADEAYVRDICRAWDVPLKAMRIDAALLAKQWGIGCEEAGRRARYEIFEECLQEMGDCHGAIAVAHHRDDCAETLLFHMFRGTGLDGMAGIRPVRKTERESMNYPSAFGNWKDRNRKLSPGKRDFLADRFYEHRRRLYKEPNQESGSAVCGKGNLQRSRSASGERGTAPGGDGGFCAQLHPTGAGTLQGGSWCFENECVRQR